MNKTQISVLSLSLFAGGEALAAEKVEWGYSGDTGPAHWGELSPNFALCGSGKNQSPINITDTIEAELDDIDLNYQAGPPLNIVNNGHTVQVNVAEGSQITVDGHTFKLLQFHFHTPSENLIDGESFALEVHLVHADAKGNLAVIGVMFEEGTAHPLLETVWAQMPQEAGGTAEPADITVDVMSMLPEDKAYYRYSGSLTTPPCSEGVRWMVLKTPVSASPEQVQHFHATMHNHDNNRPIQPPFARAVLHQSGVNIPRGKVVFGVVSTHSCTTCPSGMAFPNRIRRVTPDVLDWISYFKTVKFP